MVQESYPGKPAVGICMYPIQRFEPAVLDRVVAAHSEVLKSGCDGSSTASLRIHWPECEAEIVTDKLTIDPSYQYVVQRKGGEVLSWGQSPDFEGARKAAEAAASEPERSGGYPKHVNS
jgi:hypothetical protein